MIAVSDEWKEIHERALLPETFVEITLDVVDTPESVTVSVANEATFSNSNKIVNNSGADLSTKRATLEHNLWSLDGSCYVMRESDVAIGYVSADDTPGEVIITLGESNGNQAPGITIIWDETYGTFATEFSLRVLSGNTQTAYHTSDNDSPIFVFDFPSEGYDCIEILPIKWSHPDQRIRIDSVKLGHSVVFDKNDIISYSHEQSGSPLGTELTQNTIEFEVDNSDGRWNILNPTGLAKYLYERQRLVVRYGLPTSVGVEWIQAGVFYLSEWKAPSNGITATFAARDAVEFMLNATYSRPYLMGITTREATVYATKDDIYTTDFEYSTEGVLTTLPVGTEVKIYEQGSVRYGGDPNSPMGGYTVYRIEQGWVGGGSVTLVDSLHLEDDIPSVLQSCLPEGVPVEIGDFWGYQSRPFAIKDVNVAEFIQQCAATRGYTLWQDSTGKLHVRRLNVITRNYAISGDCSYSYPEVELVKPLKDVSFVTHYQWTDITDTYTFAFNNTGESITLDTELMLNPDMSRLESLANKYAEWWEHREIVSGEFRADPRLELFDCVEVETKYGTLYPVMITYLKYTYNGAFRAVYEGKVIDEDFYYN